MAKKNVISKKKKEFWLWTFTKTCFGLLWEIIKLPYYLVKGAHWLAPKINRTIERKVERKRVGKKRKMQHATYDDFNVIQSSKGSIAAWEQKMIEGESTIGIVLGARGSGKTAFGVRVLENVYAKTKRSVCAMGFAEESMPSWINIVKNVEEIPNDSFVLIDEGGILFNARDSMSNTNKLLSDLILISRHKNLSILFISQNSANLEINILRQADYLVLKKSALLQREFERKIIQKLYEQTSEEFERLKDKRGLTYIHSSEFVGFISNDLPSFWKSEISKSFR